MNYLAHAFLAGPIAADRVGGVAGDFVKGLLDPLPHALGPALAEGVRLHRRIDSFADTHPAFRRSRSRVSAARRRVAGIMVDLFYDHFLARHWEAVSARWPANAAGSGASLTTFTAEIYRLIDTHPEPLPAAFVPVFERMAAHDWLASYGDAASVALALDRMAAHRLRAPNPLAGAGAELLADYAGFEADFFDFLPDALAFAAQVRAARA
ncbi:acyl carrier protein phosphodiesterase [Thauera sp.]|uniref:acyl carrier protein phosphodiesterase n=1 Tax=Thauera sp. TaxID=1905334 RepID=UPI002BCBDBFA|nr:acyl carrier protein phosphodiesterase [Thauera sp.]HRP26246.1 acyl carrier protein phosphodiesterase [Thauera sp.]